MQEAEAKVTKPVHFTSSCTIRAGRGADHEQSVSISSVTIPIQALPDNIVISCNTYLFCSCLSIRPATTYHRFSNLES